MSVLGEWLGPGLKMKRWLFLVLVGTAMLSYGFAQIISNQELEIYNLIFYAITFILGFTLIIVGFIMAQRRMLQAIAEYSANQNIRNLNIKRLLYDKKMLDRNIKVVAIGDGAGLSKVLEGVKIFSNIACYLNMTCRVLDQSVIDRVNIKISDCEIRCFLEFLAESRDSVFQIILLLFCFLDVHCLRDLSADSLTLILT